jgi:sulfur carrier protein ThiS
MNLPLKNSSNRKPRVEKSRTPGAPQVTPHDPEHAGSRRDPEERPVATQDDHREKSFDKTLADSFPTSDPPSSIPDPSGNDKPLKTSSETSYHELLAKLKVGTWAALAIADQKVVGTGTTQEEAAADARRRGYGQVQLIQVPGGGTTGRGDLTKAS